MNIQINDTNKTIKLIDDIKLDELFDKLEILFPNKGWREYTLQFEKNYVLNPTIPGNPTTPINPWNEPYWPWNPYVPITPNPTYQCILQ